MKFGILNWNCHGGDYPAERQLQEVLALARVSRDAGFDSFVVNHSYLKTPVRWLQPLPLLARLAPETGAMSLVLGVFILPLHNPVEVAEQVATVDIICGGRLVFGVGIGPGNTPWEAFGLDPRHRVGRFEESLHLIKRLWTEEKVTHRGRHYSLQGARCTVKPVQDPHPPIWIGAMDPRGARRAARLADAWYPILRPLDEMERAVAYYRECLEGFERPIPPEFPIRQEVYVARDHEMAIREGSRYLEEPLSSRMGSPVNPDVFFMGSPESLVEQIGRYRERLGELHLVFRVEYVDLPYSKVLEQVELLGSLVLPHFRD